MHDDLRRVHGIWRRLFLPCILVLLLPLLLPLLLLCRWLLCMQQLLLLLCHWLLCMLLLLRRRLRRHPRRRLLVVLWLHRAVLRIGRRLVQRAVVGAVDQGRLLGCPRRHFRRHALRRRREDAAVGQRRHLQAAKMSACS